MRSGSWPRTLVSDGVGTGSSGQVEGEAEDADPRRDREDRVDERLHVHVARVLHDRIGAGGALEERLPVPLPLVALALARLRAVRARVGAGGGRVWQRRRRLAELVRLILLG